MPPDPTTPQLTRRASFIFPCIRANHLEDCLPNLVHVRFVIRRICKTGESVVLVPARIGHVHRGVIYARGAGVFLGRKRKTGPPKRVVLLESPLGMALRPEPFP